MGLDRVAAIRFASVYRNFDAPGDFEAELRRLAAGPIPSDPEGSIGGSPVTTSEGEPHSSATARREHVE